MRLQPFTAAAILALTGCAANMGAPKEIPVTAVALRASETATPGQAAQAITGDGEGVALLLSAADDAWFRATAGAAGLFLSGPARTPDGLGLAFLGPEPLGDTAIDLRYDGGTVTLQDALYEVDDDRYLDLLAFQVDDAAAARPLTAALLSYIATDVEASAAVVMAVAVPSQAVGDSVARMLSPGFDDAPRCEGSDDTGLEGLRLFYGPEARIFCRSATATEAAVGEIIRARLVMGRR